VKIRALLLALVLVAFAFPAGAASPNNPKANIQADNSNCGNPTTGAVIGFVNYHRTGDRVSFQYHLKHGKPGHTYVIQLWGDLCSFFGQGRQFTTNRNGVGNVNASFAVPHASTRFFATAFDPAVLHWHDSLAVTLAP
jgi:hypothetical protein